MWLNQLYRRWTGRMRTNRRARRAAARPRTRLTLEALEERTLLSAPDPVTITGMSGQADNPYPGGGSVSGMSFLGGSFNTSGTVGGISDGFGAELNLSLNGKAGLDLGYSASGGSVNASYANFTLKQNYVEPTQFDQNVNFTPQNTKVSYTDGLFKSTAASLSASANLDVSLNGSVGGTVEAFGKSAGGSTNFSASTTAPLFNIALGPNDKNELGVTTLSLLGQYLEGGPNQATFLQNAAANVYSIKEQLTPVPIPSFAQLLVQTRESPLSLTGDLKVGLGQTLPGVSVGDKGTDVGIATDLGSLSASVPDIQLSSGKLQNNGVLTDSESGEIAGMKIEMGPVAARLLPFLGSYELLTDTDTVRFGPVSLSITPVSFTMGPTLDLVQTGTLTPTNTLTYNFFDHATGQAMNVEVTEDGVDLGQQSSVTFTPGVDTIGIKFTGAPIEVHPTWTYGLNYTDEYDMDADLVGTLTVGKLSASIQNVGSYTLGPLYQKNFTFAKYKLGSLYYKTFSLVDPVTDSLPSFVIGSTFPLSLAVTTTSDNNKGGEGSLRDAVLSANATGGSTPQIIHLGPGTYELTIPPSGQDDGSRGDLHVASNLIIEGAGVGQTIINASALGDRLFTVASGANLTLQGVTLAGVSTSSNGGGILNYGNLTLENSEIIGNAADNGGGIYNEQGGTLTIDDSTLSYDQAASGAGGGIYNSGTATIDDSTLSNNGAVGGGGIVNGPNGGLTIRNSTLSDNGAGVGGGIYNKPGGILLIDNSTLYGNTSLSSGGALWESSKAAASLINDTLTQNRANYGGSYSAGVGGGIYVAAGGGDPLLGNTIVAGNYNGASSSTTPDDINGPVNTTDSANNLIGAGGSGELQNGSNGNRVGVADPRLGVLGDNGGPTQTVQLLTNSPAINGGGNSWATRYGLSTDQRGYSRIVNRIVDIGAVQYQYDLGLSGYLAPGTVPGRVQYVYTVTNNGPDPVAGVAFKVPLPEGMAFESLTLPSGWSESDPGLGDSGTVSFSHKDDLNSGQLTAFTITAQVQNVPVGTVLTNTATVDANVWDNNPQNNSLTLTVADEQESQAFNAVKLFHFSDANLFETADDFTAYAGWGDGSGNISNDGSGTVSVVADPAGGFDVLGSHTYAQSGNYGTAVMVAGLDGTQYSSGNVLQKFDNMKLLHFTGSPGAPASAFTASVAWGDGTTSTITSTPSKAGQIDGDSKDGYEVLGSHSYALEGDYTITTAVTGLSTFHAGRQTITTASNVETIAPQQMFVAAAAPLTAGDLTPPPNATRNHAVATFQNVLLFYFTDSKSPNAAAGDFTAAVNWGDNSSNTSSDGSGSVSVVADSRGGFDVVGSHNYAAVGDYQVSVSVSGLDGTTYSQTQTFQYGAKLFHFTDEDPNHTASDYTATVNWGDNTTNNSGDGAVVVVADPGGGFDVIGSHTYTQTVNSAKFGVRVSDEGGANAGGAGTSGSAANFQVQNSDQPLTAGALNVPSVTMEGQSISNQVLFHFSDPDSDAQAGDYVAAVSWGDSNFNSSDDGSGSVVVVADPSGGFNVVGSHTYGAGSYYFWVKVTDQGDPRSSSPDTGGQSTGASSSTPLTLADPPVTATAGPTFTAVVNTPSAVQTVATFTDPGGPQSNPNAYLATIQWGDGTSTKAALNFIEDLNSQGDLIASQQTPGIVLSGDGKTFSVNLAHQYAQAGSYALSITINHDGQLSQTTTTALVTAPAPPPSPSPAPSPAPHPAPIPPPTLQVPPLLAFFDSLLGAVETINANHTETLTASFFGIPLLVSTFDSSGKLETVLLFGMNVTALFELL